MCRAADGDDGARTVQLQAGEARSELVSGLGIVALIPLAILVLRGLVLVNPNHSKAVLLFGVYKGTIRDAGYFWIGNTSSQKIVLCESAIDAISCFQLQPRGACICISTAGVRATAPWLDPLLNRGYQIYCGFDADEAGERASQRMSIRHPSVQRLRPPRHDWNDALRSH